MAVAPVSLPDCRTLVVAAGVAELEQAVAVANRVMLSLNVCVDVAVVAGSQCCVLVQNGVCVEML